MKAGARTIIVYPLDPEPKSACDGTRLNRILPIRGDPSAMDAATAPSAAEGVLADPTFCTHQGCDVNSWVAAEKVLLCFCHFSTFDPLQEAAWRAGRPRAPCRPCRSKSTTASWSSPAASRPPGKDA